MALRSGPCLSLDGGGGGDAVVRQAQRRRSARRKGFSSANHEPSSRRQSLSEASQTNWPWSVSSSAVVGLSAVVRSSSVVDQADTVLASRCGPFFAACWLSVLRGMCLKCRGVALSTTPPLVIGQFQSDPTNFSLSFRGNRVITQLTYGGRAAMLFDARPCVWTRISLLVQPQLQRETLHEMAKYTWPCNCNGQIPQQTDGHGSPISDIAVPPTPISGFECHTGSVRSRLPLPCIVNWHPS
jgi:hypothetical protein